MHGGIDNPVQYHFLMMDPSDIRVLQESVVLNNLPHHLPQYPTL